MQEWKTADLPEKDRFSYWREVLCEAYVALDPISPDRNAFNGNVFAQSLSTINVTRISSTRQEIYRGADEIRRMPIEVYFLNLQVRGRSRMSQAGRTANVGPGEFSIVDSTEPYLIDCYSDDWEQYSFRIPRHLLSTSLSNSEKSTAVLVGGSSGIGSVAVEHLMSIASRAEQLTESADVLCKSLVDLTALALGATAEAQHHGKQSARKALCVSIENHVKMNVADPEICPAKVAAHFGISLRYLHKVLADEAAKTFGRIVLEQRLDRCAREFDIGGRKSITDIAMLWGFNDLSHFSRTFRHRFSMSPREYRHGKQSAQLLLDASKGR